MLSKTLRSFRKNQKAWLAGLTILCMVSFVMCSGIVAGSNLLESFGVRFGQSKGAVVATLYGRDILAREIQDLQKQRKLANQYMDYYTFISRENAFKAIQEASQKWDETTRRLLSQSVSIIRGFDPQVLQIPGYAKFFEERGLANPKERLNQAFQMLDLMRDNFARDKKTTEASLVDDLSFALRQELQRRLKQKDLYFGGTTSLEDILDFMIWRHEADRRGIQLTPENIHDLIKKETDNRGVPNAELRKIVDSLQRNSRNSFSIENLDAALADELRVRIAKT